MTGRNDLVDECRPVVGPFLLEDGYEDQIQLVEKGPLALQALFAVRALDDEADYKVAYA